MILRGSSRMNDDTGIYDDAVKFYAHWRDLHPKASAEVLPGSRLEQALDSRRRDSILCFSQKVETYAKTNPKASEDPHFYEIQEKIRMKRRL